MAQVLIYPWNEKKSPVAVVSQMVGNLIVKLYAQKARQRGTKRWEMETKSRELHMKKAKPSLGKLQVHRTN